MDEAIALHNAVDEFHEDWRWRTRRWILGTAAAVRPPQLSILPRLLLMTAGHLLKSRQARLRLPSELRFYGDAGLLGLCDDLRVPALLDAYSHGVFPYHHLGPMKWWSPRQRAVLFLDNVHIESSVRKLAQRGIYRVSFDEAFGDVMESCAKPRDGKTPLKWLTPKVMDAYLAMYHAGYAHSVEVWDSNGVLVGGMYGIAIGDVFFGESQFSTKRDTSKLASTILNRHLFAWGFALRDVKWISSYHVNAEGYVLIPREALYELLREHTTKPSRTDLWEIDDSLDLAEWKPARGSPPAAI